MKQETKIHMVLRHVGEQDSAEKMQHWYGTMREVIRGQTIWMLTHTMLTRIDICMGRTKEECEARLREQQHKPRGKHAIVLPDGEADEMLSQIFANAANMSGEL